MRSVYVGRGDIAHLEAVLLAMQREDRQARRMKEQEQLRALDPLEEDIDALSRLTSTLTHAALVAAGFHQHRRQWRKRRA